MGITSGASEVRRVLNTGCETADIGLACSLSLGPSSGTLTASPCLVGSTVRTKSTTRQTDLKSKVLFPMNTMNSIPLALVLACLISFSHATEPCTSIGDFALHYHLMHPGDESWPQDPRMAFTGDPNAAYQLDGTYHLHYIFKTEWEGELSFAYAHVTSPDMLNWSWQPTKLTPSFAGHGMFSGTGFLTTEGLPAMIYHGQASNRNWIAVAKDRQLSAWKKPVSIEPVHPDGSRFESKSYWDPDLFVIGDTYYSISGGAETPLFKSPDLETWTYVGPFLSHEPDNVAHGEDVSCANFFPSATRESGCCSASVTVTAAATISENGMPPGSSSCRRVITA